MTQSEFQNIPIDVHANKLVDWLISRHHCTKEWPEKIALVRQKINAAIQDMPEHATIGKILRDASPINYFHCVRIVEVLKETEADSKNFLGMYGSKRMKDWQEILKLYQKDCLYLAECGAILARNVIYEVPAMKRLVSKAEQSMQECQKKETGSRKQAQEYRDKFVHNCNQLGIRLENFDPKNANHKPPSAASIGNQLVALMSQELPEIFKKIASKSKDVDEAVSFYRQFLKSTIGLKEDQEKTCLGLLRLVIDKGNVTAYEWKYGEAPLKVEPPVVTYQFDQDPTDLASGDGSLDLDADVGDIDFGDDIQLETGDIDWGGIETSDDVEIDFSVDNLEVETCGIVLEEDGVEGGVARNEEALSLLENPETRNFFIDELLELEGFLIQRIEEKKTEKPNEMMLSSHGDTLSVETLEKYLRLTNQVLQMFNENKTKQLLLVRESKRYTSRITEGLLQNIKLAKKLDYAAENAIQKNEQLQAEISSVKPKIQILSKQSRELQTELAKELSAKYNNRPVYITGGL
ncbi:CDK5 regulatory subunit-associated protein 3 [Orchesella cincta]|uniref:CDK5 regulatory subunit-associated protein 3 n=1 Tax=Orchesella cincta TaxID=48709 RepID=A0A1D2N4I9_ORCCI|nr:CDK5 regulatory subunit-associated protein 3 [Orchesella cincta]